MRQRKCSMESDFVTLFGNEAYLWTQDYKIKDENE